MKRYSRNLLVAFLAVSALVMGSLHWLNGQGRFPLHEGEVPLNYLVAISIYDGFALAGLLVLARYITRDRQFFIRLALLLALAAVAVVVGALVDEPSPDPLWLLAVALWETARIACVAFAVAFVAHAMMVRYLPSTLLRVRDITPVLVDGKATVHGHRLKHMRRTRWLFDLKSRDYLDTTKLELRTLRGPSFDWRSWGEASFWASMGLIALSVYAEAYPRVEADLDLLFTAVVTGHLLSIVPILVLPVYPIQTVGPTIPVERGVFRLAHGFKVNLHRWVKIAFFPIIAVGLLFRTLSWENAEELLRALLLTIPTATITCLVYLECFRNRTAGEVHRAIAQREERERVDFGEEPWRRTSLLEGVDVIESDIRLE